MKGSNCKSCINNEICGYKSIDGCEHYDVALTRKEVIDLLKVQSPTSIPAVLNAIKRTYRINLAY